MMDYSGLENMSNDRLAIELQGLAKSWNHRQRTYRERLLKEAARRLTTKKESVDP